MKIDYCIWEIPSTVDIFATLVLLIPDHLIWYCKFLCFYWSTNLSIAILFSEFRTLLYYKNSYWLELWAMRLYWYSAILLWLALLPLNWLLYDSSFSLFLSITEILPHFKSLFLSFELLPLLTLLVILPIWYWRKLYFGFTLRCLVINEFYVFLDCSFKRPFPPSW